MWSNHKSSSLFGGGGGGISLLKYSLVLLVLLVMVKHARSAVEEIDIRDEKVQKRYQVAHFNFEEVSSVYAITLWILLGSLAKIGRQSFLFYISFIKIKFNEPFFFV